MRCKIFSVPLESEKAFEKERKLNDFLGATNVKRVFASLANQPEGPLWSVLFLYEDEAQVTQKAPASPGVTMDPGTPLTGEQVKSIVALKKWRADQAAQEGVPLYMVAQNRWLEDIVRMPARSLDDLTKVKGLGEWRVQKYGAKMVEILNSASSAKRSWPASSYSAGRA
ncbi:MAG TPA: HRDC domain-containing protein [Terriglobia bacterium]|nr:HRDC domain-containing protein [Terriglobia bacterium]